MPSFYQFPVGPHERFTGEMKVYPIFGTHVTTIEIGSWRYEILYDPFYYYFFRQHKGESYGFMERYRDLSDLSNSLAWKELPIDERMWIATQLSVRPTDRFDAKT